MVQISYRWRNYPPHQERDYYRARTSAILSDIYKSGKKVIDLAFGDVPRYKEDGFRNTVAEEHLVQVVKEGWGMYPSETCPPGLGQSDQDARVMLRKAVCDFLENQRGIHISPEHVLLGHGVSGCFTMINNVLLDPGDEIVTIEPSHYCAGNGVGGVPIFLGKVVAASSDPDKSWEPNLEELRSCINRRTKFVLLDHPTNPCGVIYSDKTLKRIIDIAGEYDLPLIVDEMYQLITYDGLKAKSVASLSQDVPVITLESTSKFWMLPGWSLGYACFQDPECRIEELESTLMKLANYTGFGTSRIPTPIMVAAARTFVDPEAIDLCSKAIKVMESRRNFTCKRLNEIQGLSMRVKPQVAHYGLIKVEEIGEKDSRWSNDDEFTLEVLKEEGLLFVSGSKYGKSAFGQVRVLLYRNMEVLAEAYDKLERFVEKAHVRR